MNKIEKFEVWLKKRECKILETKTQYEVIRWKGRRTGIVYESGKYGGDYSRMAFIAFEKGREWEAYPAILFSEFKALKLSNARITQDEQHYIAEGYGNTIVEDCEIEEYAKAYGYKAWNIQTWYDKELNRWQWSSILDKLTNN